MHKSAGTHSCRNLQEAEVRHVEVRLEADPTDKLVPEPDFRLRDNEQYGSMTWVVLAELTGLTSTAELALAGVVRCIARACGQSIADF